MSQINAFGQTVGDIVPDWTARPYPARISAEGRHCRIDPLSPAHADDLYRAFSLAPDGRYWTWLPDEPPQDAAEYRARIEKNAQSSDPLFFTITDKQKIGMNPAPVPKKMRNRRPRCFSRLRISTPAKPLVCFP